MAQNISILEGGTAQQFGQVNKLKIANSGGGTSLWIPEDEVNTKSLHVDSNGTYYASQDECYGYDEVSVNITDECFGYDDDGNLWDVEVDDDDFLEEEEMPVRIEVTTPPTKTSYIAYEPINTAGMVVTAYYADGTEYGEIPREEYTIDPIVATGGTSEDIYSDGDGVNVLKIRYTPHRYIWSENQSTYTSYAYTKMLGTKDGKSVTLGGNDEAELFVTIFENNLYAKLVSGNNECNVYKLDSSPYTLSGGSTETAIGEDTIYHLYSGTSARTDTQRFKWLWTFDSYHNIPISTKDPNDAGTLIPDNVQEVAVIWERDDGEVLETSFDVNVSDIPVPPVSGDDSGGGGSSGGEDPEHPITPHI